MYSFDFSTLVFYFFVYSVIGFVLEVIFCSIPQKRFVNRGFLYGPYCPIYGFGALLIAMLLESLKWSPVLLFLASMLACSLLEYVSGWFFEKFLGVRLWDYSNKRIQLHGRVCLTNSVLFGVLGLVLSYLIHPFLTSVVARVETANLRVLASILLSILLVDTLASFVSAFKISAKLRDLREEIDRRLKQVSEAAKSRPTLKEYISEKFSDISYSDRKLKTFLHSFGARGEEFANARDEISSYLKEKREIQKARKKAEKEARAQKERDQKAAKTAENTFAYGIGFYKLFWVFVAGSVIGYVVETIFCFLTLGRIESRQGMLYGPFSQIYGFGAVLMLIALHWFSRRSKTAVFIGSALIGGGFEIVCSLVQEALFGTVSWDYSGHDLNIAAGRTSVAFMVCWGFLGIFFIYWVYPKLSDLIEKIPKKQGILLSWILFFLLLVDGALSSVAVARWTDRQQGIPPANAYFAYIDERYPDDYMEEVYPNMVLVDDEGDAD
ncbi:hypothetical protein LJC34_03510 [Oscillospiraceae bacterium OttesenSCG-928-G22]|nr:hypothetical protein [Oscillospiraceae bacterium OttesenSCG-928-G22]